jgi:heme-degrading monooxygenase HmoA
MFSRNVSYKLKAKSAAEFTRIVEGEVIPLLRRQKGFDDAISFIAPERNEAITISLWDKKEDAEAHIAKTYPEILRALSSVVEGSPKVESFEISNSTSHQIAASPVN